MIISNIFTVSGQAVSVQLFSKKCFIYRCYMTDGSVWTEIRGMNLIAVSCSSDQRTLFGVDLWSYNGEKLVISWVKSGRRIARAELRTKLRRTQLFDDGITECTEDL